jgi:hypothetical protein
LLSLRVRDGDGVPSATGVEVMLVAEALGGALAPLPFGGSILASDLLSMAGAPDSWLAEIAGGEARYGLALTPDLLALADVRSMAGAIGWDVDQAGHVLAMSGSSGRERRVVRVALDGRFQREPSGDLTRTLVRNRSGAVEVEDAGGPVMADSLQRWLALAITTVSADVVGAMRAGLSGVVDYSKERVQYGVPIGSFQAVQHLCAEALIKTEAAASATDYAAWAVDILAPAEALLAARTAKAYCCFAAREVTETVMQVYGGIGQTWEHVAHLYTRRVLMDQQLFGDQSEQLLRIADSRLG